MRRINPNYSVSEVCKAFGVSRSGYHHHVNAKMTTQRANRIRLVAAMKAISTKGNCYNNATCESFFSTLKRELLPDSGYFETRVEARNAIFENIEGFYNTRIRHSSLGNISPCEYIKKTQPTCPNSP